SLTSVTFTRQHPTLAEFMERETDRDLQLARILVDKSVVKYIRNDLVSWGLSGEIDRGDQIEMHFKSRHLDEGLARWFMLFGDYMDVVQPESLRERMVELAQKIQERLKK